MDFNIINLICSLPFGLCAGGMCAVSAPKKSIGFLLIIISVIFSGLGGFYPPLAYPAVFFAEIAAMSIFKLNIGEAVSISITSVVSSFAIMMFIAAITSPSVEPYSYIMREMFYYELVHSRTAAALAATAAPLVVFATVWLNRSTESGRRLAVCTISLVGSIAVIMLLHMCAGSFIDYNAKFFKRAVSYAALNASIAFLCIILFFIIASKFRKSIDFSDNLSEMKEFYIIPIAVICTILFYCYENAVLNNYTTFEAPKYKYTVSILIVLMIVTMLAALIAVCTYMIRSRAERSRIERQIELTEMYRNEIRGIQREIFDFKHDYVKIYSSMSSFIINGEYEKLRDFFDKNIVPLQKELINSDKGSKELAMLEDEAVQGLVYSYIIKAKKAGVNLITDIRDNIPVSDVPVIDLNRLLGIFLDNAIEHSIKSDRTVCFAAIRQDDCTIFVITNSAEGVDMERMFKYGESTKGKNRGRGLAIARKICAAHDQLSMHTYSRNGKFVCEIYIGDE